MKKLWTFAGLALVGAAYFACGGGGGGPTSPGQGTLEVYLTDAPTLGLEQINVFVVGLSVKPETGPLQQIANELGTVDLLKLQDVTRLLAAAGLEPGRYVHVRVDLDQDRSNVVEQGSREELPLQIASEQIKVLGGFDLERRRTTRVTLDFDALQSMRQKGNGDWLMVPVIIQTNVEMD